MVCLTKYHLKNSYEFVILNGTEKFWMTLSRCIFFKYTLLELVKVLKVL